MVITIVCCYPIWELLLLYVGIYRKAEMGITIQCWYLWNIQYGNYCCIYMLVWKLLSNFGIYRKSNMVIY